MYCFFIRKSIQLFLMSPVCLPECFQISEPQSPEPLQFSGDPLSGPEINLPQELFSFPVSSIPTVCGAGGGNAARRRSEGYGISRRRVVRPRIPRRSRRRAAHSGEAAARRGYDGKRGARPPSAALALPGESARGAVRAPRRRRPPRWRSRPAKAGRTPGRAMRTRRTGSRRMRPRQVRKQPARPRRSASRPTWRRHRPLWPPPSWPWRRPRPTSRRPPTP